MDGLDLALTLPTLIRIISLSLSLSLSLALCVCLFCSWEPSALPLSLSSCEEGGFGGWRKLDIGCGFEVGLLLNLVFVGDWRSKMERDFLGLGSKEPLAAVKEEVNNDGCTEPGLFLSYSSSFWWVSSTFSYSFICSFQILCFFFFFSFES